MSNEIEGYWLSIACINWHHLDCRIERCECKCHIMTPKEEEQ